ncbi:MAG: hypothetical protein ABII13_04695 [Patescibacteria group bacterium]
MRTVRDFMDHILPAPVEDMRDEIRRSFFEARPGRKFFWKKLCRLGFEKATKTSSECLDIDATAPLTDEEWDELQAEFDAL